MLRTGLARVDMLVAHNGADGALVDAAVNAGSRGLIVQAFGRGNTPPEMYAAIRRVIGEGVCVVICSQCWGGHTAPLYGYDGGGATLKSAGAVFCPALNGAKARIALSFLLGGNSSRTQIEQFFQNGSLT
jgi:L-asparaginase